jgi:hypothetical protein
LLAAFATEPEYSEAPAVSVVKFECHPTDSNEAPRNLHVMEYFEKIFFW